MLDREWPQSRAPSIKNISLENIGWRKDHIFTPSKKVNLNIEYLKYNNKKIVVEYELFPEAFSDKIGGDIQKSPKPIKFEIINKNDNEITFLTPKKERCLSNICLCKKRKGTKLSC